MGRIATLLASIALLACSGQVHEASIVLALEYPPPHELAIEPAPSPRESPDGLASPNSGFVKRYVEELNLDRMIDELDLRSRVTVEELERSISVEIRDELSILRVVPSSRFPAEEVADYLVQSAIGAHREESIYAFRRRGSFWLGESVRACVRERDEDSPRAPLPRCARACRGLAEVWILEWLSRHQLADLLRVFDGPNSDPVPALGLTSDTVHVTLILDRGILSGACQGVWADSDYLLHHLSTRLTADRSQLSTIIDEAGLYPDESASLERMAVIDMMRDAIAMTDLPGATQSERRFRLAFAYETRAGAQRGVRALALALVADHEKALEACVEQARAFTPAIEVQRTGDWVEAVPHFEVRLHVPVMREEAMRRSLWEACDPWILEDIDRLRHSVDRMARSRPRLRTVGDVEPGLGGRSMGARGLLISLLLAFAVASLATPLMLRLARSRQIVDRPTARSVSHPPNIPLWGGLAVAAGFGAGLLLALWLSGTRPAPGHLGGMLAGGLVILVLGVWDDRFGLGATVKFALQIAAAAIAIAAGYQMDHLTEPITRTTFVFTEPLVWLASGLWIVGVTNALNLIDGLDGLAAGVGAIICATLTVILLQTGEPFGVCVGVALLGGLLGFLPYNFWPARILLGNSGSLFIGYTLALLSLEGYRQVTVITFVVPLIALAMPILVAVLSVARRVRVGAPVFPADRLHIRHQLLASGGSGRSAVLHFYLLTALFCLMALAFVDLRGYVAVVVLSVVFALALWHVRKLGFLSPVARDQAAAETDEDAKKSER